MKWLFGKKKNEFTIADDDREWIEGTFLWLLSIYGTWLIKRTQIQWNSTYFPLSFTKKEISHEKVIADLQALLGLSTVDIRFSIETDLRDMPGALYAMDNPAFEAATTFSGEFYQIQLSQTLLRHPNRLLFCLCIELTRIKLHAIGTVGEIYAKPDQLLILTATSFGLGPVLSLGLQDIGVRQHGIWEVKWFYGCQLPMNLFAFAIAVSNKMATSPFSQWNDAYPGDIAKKIEQAERFLEASPGESFDSKKVELAILGYDSHQHYLAGRFDQAIDLSIKALELPDSPLDKAWLLNNIGYYYLRKKAPKDAIPFLEEAILHDPEMAYAYDNLGYALVLTQQPKEAKPYLDFALQLASNDPGYTHRNFALYHMAMGEPELAAIAFDRAFQAQTVPVDLLEYHYSEFLFAQGQKEKAMEFLRMAVAKNEPEAIERLALLGES